MSITASALAAASDADLVDAVLHGDDGAFTEIYARYQPALVRQLRRLVGDRGHAQDLSHEALLRALNALATFDRAMPLWPWLQRIARNAAIDAFRRAEAPAVPLPDALATTDDQLEGFRTRWTIDEALRGVAPRHRDALVLRYLHGFSNGEAAVKLGMTRAAFDQLLLRARAALRREYQRLVDDPSDRAIVPLWLLLGRSMVRVRERCRDWCASLIGGVTASAPAVSESMILVVVGAVTVATAFGAPAEFAPPARPPAVQTQAEPAPGRPEPTKLTGARSAGGSGARSEAPEGPRKSAPAARVATTSVEVGNPRTQLIVAGGGMRRSSRNNAVGTRTEISSEERKTGNETTLGVHCESGVVTGAACAAADATAPALSPVVEELP